MKILPTIYLNKTKIFRENERAPNLIIRKGIYKLRTSYLNIMFGGTD